MATIEWERYVETDDGEEETVVDLPAKWEICSVCDGEGKHSHALGAITEEDRARDWDADEWEGYLSGAYDSPCGQCKGTGKVLVVDYATLERSNPELFAARVAWEESEDDYRALCEMERRMGA